MSDGAFAPVAVTTRSGAEESFHRGAVVALDADGSVAWAVGDPDVAIYARSALKPVQAAAMMTAGLELDDRSLAVVCASHDGRPEHVAAVRAILAGAGLDESCLQNTPTLPLDDDAMGDAIRAGLAAAPILQNCSGKHAGMLATAVINGWATSGYTAADHPLQRMIVGELERTVGPVRHIGVDGCGAPAAIVPLIGLARAVRALAVEGHPVHRAMTAHPDMVGGPTRDVTRLMRLVPGLMAKDGAEGVHVAAMADGRAVALKVADGGGRARVPVMVAALRSLGVGLAADALPEAILGHGEPVGRVHSLVGEP